MIYMGYSILTLFFVLTLLYKVIFFSLTHNGTSGQGYRWYYRFSLFTSASFIALPPMIATKKYREKKLYFENFVLCEVSLVNFPTIFFITTLECKLQVHIDVQIIRTLDGCNHPPSEIAAFNLVRMHMCILKYIAYFVIFDFNCYELLNSTLEFMCKTQQKRMYDVKCAIE